MASQLFQLLLRKQGDGLIDSGGPIRLAGCLSLSQLSLHELFTPPIECGI